jgi:hypothetical protein
MSGGRARRRAVAGLRLLGRGGVVEPVGDGDAQQRSGARRAGDGGRGGGKAMSCTHGRSEIEAGGGRAGLVVRTA